MKGKGSAVFVEIGDCYGFSNEGLDIDEGSSTDCWNIAIGQHSILPQTYI